ncbi:hypothetical protein CI109_106814 [Kwoniella shandongensis]|uniref:Uncharacterized protein n=1 Tax=Kwoniella shandongensis TaxID=1734106 RepID=A0A5M6CCB9_9TREE|nr:uncharacterized protein CI109_000929 [Kwoniella shandongensis]KAA5530749.1 hypothetical protein CI109_000929 [Kwoniella shandongensis]
MSLRPQLLSSALTHLPVHSFTRPSLVRALRDVKPDISDPEAVIDTLFGPGSVGPTKALVERWEEEGRGVMQSGEGREGDGLEVVLRKRLEYSSQVGEHLVEAYANLATPSTSHSIPLPLNVLLFPSLPILRALLNTGIKTPPLYSPPSTLEGTPSPSQSSSTSSQNPKVDASSILSYLNEKVQSTDSTRLPLPLINPLGPFAYAWRIADHALFITQGKGRKVGEVKKGYWNEPVGAGPEWYGQRLGLALAYLSAESRLLQPYPAHPSTSTPTTNPHLPAALSSLSKNLARYQSFNKSVANTEHNLGETMGFLDFVGRSWRGIIRSRYW